MISNEVGELVRVGRTDGERLEEGEDERVGAGVLSEFGKEVVGLKG